MQNTGRKKETDVMVLMSSVVSISKTHFRNKTSIILSVGNDSSHDMSIFNLFSQFDCLMISRQDPNMNKAQNIHKLRLRLLILSWFIDKEASYEWAFDDE